MIKNLIFKSTLLGLILLNTSLQSQPCSGTPNANSVVSSAYTICPGATVTFSLATPYVNTGLVYQWAYSSFTSAGPWSPISGANGTVLTTNTLVNSGYYTCVIVCTAVIASTTASPVYLNIGATTMTTSVPYFENFNLTTPNTLPNCSWSASSLGTNCLTYTTGNGNAAFAYSVSSLGTENFYSMGVQLNTSIVYSVAIFNSTQAFQQNNNWTAFGISVGTLQSTVGSTLVTSNAPPATGPYSLRSATFTVPNSGIYYLRIFATSVSGTSVSAQLYFDDLSLTIPCNYSSSSLPPPSGPNSPLVVINPTAGVICIGQSITFTFIPGPNTTLNIPTNTLTYTPSGSASYSIQMTNTLTGCVGTASFQVSVNPTPNVVATASTTSICKGGQTSIMAFGAQAYTLNPGGTTGNTFNVSPTATTIYTITGDAGCLSTNTIQINVIALPVITLTASSSELCYGESIQLTASGAASYVWGNILGGNTYSYAPTSNTILMVSGTSAQGCVGTASLNIIVNSCLGGKELEDKDNRFSFFPNPTIGHFEIISKSNNYFIEISDFTGRIVYRENILQLRTIIDLSKEAKGVYFLKTLSDDMTENFRLILE